MEINEIKKLKFELGIFTKVIEEMNDGIYITDSNAKTLLLNKSYERISGTSRELFLGKTMMQIVKEKLIDKSVTLEVLKQKKEVTMNQTLNNGKKVLITGTPIYSDDGKLDMVVTVVRDITNLNKLQEQLHIKQMEIDKLKLFMGRSDNLIYRSDSMRNVIKRAEKCSNYDTTVLITGETGVGKDMVAKFIHKNGNRKDKVFMEINCAAIPPTLLESELFGYEKGAFTGASKQGKKGIFELANGGSIFLDEIGEMPLSLQAKLLKVIQDKKIYKIGGEKHIPIDVKIITASNKNLQEMVNMKRFRSDLYYRLNVIPINIPPLRQRKEDILLLVDFFLQNIIKSYGEEKKLDEKAMKLLYDYSYPGNIRELKNLVERAYILSSNNIITDEDFPSELKYSHFNISTEKYKEISLSEAVSNLERDLIKEAIEKTSTNKEAAILLGLEPSTFTRKKQKYKL